MMALRNAMWAAMLLTAFVGCAKEEPAAETTTPPVPVGNEAVVPPATPAVDEKPAAGTGADMVKPSEPKEEGLKLDAPAVTPPAANKEEAKGDEAALTADELIELASLSPADKEIALKQVLCPVSGEHLGSMGTPVKVSAEGKSFMICCGGCKDDVKDKPKEVVAKLKK